MASLARSLQPFAVAFSRGTARRALSTSAARGLLRTPASRRAGFLRPIALTPRDYALSSRFASVSANVRTSDGPVKNRLVQLLEKEIEHENGNSTPDEENFVSDFLEKEGWKIHSKEGHDEVSMTKTFKNENVTVTFSLSDINRQEDQYQDELDQENDEEVEESEEERPVSVNAIVNCEKPDNGVLSFDVILEDDDVIIQSAAHYPSKEIAVVGDPVADWTRRGLYGGPAYSELEEDLQDTFREYIEERGINANLSDFVTKYVTLGEQKEYVNWLKLVKDHVKA